jgi:8-oxo-dGTP diphosphatase
VVGVMHRRAADERIDFLLVASRWAGTIANMEPDKCDALAWFPVDHLPANVVPYVRRALDNYRCGRWFESCGWTGAH